MKSPKSLWINELEIRRPTAVCTQSLSAILVRFFSRPSVLAGEAIVLRFQAS